MPVYLYKTRILGAELVYNPRMNDSQQFSTTLTSPQKAIDALEAICPLSRSTIKDAMQKGAVWYQRGKQTHRIRRQDRKLEVGDELFLYYNPSVLAQICPKAELIADEGGFSVWYKPSGMLSQGSKWSDHCTINRWAEIQLQPQRTAFIVNRLDRAAQGLMLIAHTKSMARFLSNLFQQHAIYKAYVAKVQGTGIKAGTCTLPIDDKKAVSHIHLLDTNTNNSLVKVEIETGRKHQIRIHLAHLGHPIVGDRQRHPEPHTEDLALACSELVWADANGTERQYRLPKHLLPTL